MLWKKIIVVLVLLIGFLVGFVYWKVHSLAVTEVTPDLHVLYGIGGNVGVLKTGAGTVIVDTMTFTFQGKRIREVAEDLTGEPIVMVINSHYHSDHTHGNPAFDKGTRVIATERTLHHLKVTDAEYFAKEASALLPNETFQSSQVVKLGNKTLRLIHPGQGHTDGDLVVLFEEDKAVHMGDLFFNHRYPNIDLEGGGSIVKWGISLSQVLALDFQKVIPGHGPLSGREDLLQFQGFVQQLAGIGQRAADQGLTLEDTLATKELTEDKGYEEVHMIIPVGLDREFVLKRSWEEATGNYTLRD